MGPKIKTNNQIIRFYYLPTLLLAFVELEGLILLIPFWGFQ
jgi:hypothetical protein